VARVNRSAGWIPLPSVEWNGAQAGETHDGCSFVMGRKLEYILGAVRPWEAKLTITVVLREGELSREI